MEDRGNVTEPLVSVVVRSTGRPTLGEALTSLERQRHPAVEVVLVDAAGTRPASPACARPLRVVSTGAPLARSAAANVGLEAARGDFLMLLDDDDWLEPEHVSALVAALSEPDAPRAAYGGVRAVCEDSAGGWRTLEVFDDPWDPLRLTYENYIPVHAVLFARELFGAGCRFTPELDVFEDWDFWLQLRERTAFRHVPGVRACYRWPGASPWHRSDPAGSERAAGQVLDRWVARWSGEPHAALLRALRRGEIHQCRVLTAALAAAEDRRHAAELALDGERGGWGRERDAWEAERAALVAQVDAWRSLRGEAMEEVERLRACVADIERQLAELKASATWRLTGPLRAALDRARSRR